MKNSVILFAAVLFCSGPAFASGTLPVGVSSCGLDLRVRFVESAPRDRFTLENRSTPQWSVTSASLKLAPSAGRLIFDTEAGGTGVEAIADFREERSTAKLRRVSKLRDGGEEVTLDFSSFEAGEDFTFSIDVDDRLKQSELGQIRVRGGEIDGARVEFVLRAPGGVITAASAAFSGTELRLKGRQCG